MRFSLLLLLAACGSSSSVTNDAGGDVVVTPQSGTWVWQSDAPSGQLNAIWASAANDAWAVGDDGLMIHWDGSAWSVVDPATTNHINGIWGSSSSDVWAVGGGLGGPNTANLVHWNGKTWSVVDPGTTSNLDSVWGTSAKDVYVAGASGVDGTIQHWDGTSWSSAFYSHEFAPKAIFGSSGSDVWVAGGTLYPTTDVYMLHGSVQSFTPFASGASQDLAAVWSADATHAWAFGAGGLMRWDGKNWSGVTTSLVPGVGGLWGTSATSVWAVGNDQQIVAWNGSAWTADHGDAIGGRLRAIGGADAAHRWAVGEDVVMRFDTSVTSAPACADVRGQCSDASCSSGHVSDYACSGGATCCVVQVACGGTEPQCCEGGNPGARAICHNGAFYCPSPSTTCPLHP